MRWYSFVRRFYVILNKEVLLADLQIKISKLLGHNDASVIKLSDLSGTLPSLNEKARFYVYETEVSGVGRRFFVKLTPPDHMYLGVNELALMTELPVPALRAKSVWRGYLVAVFDFIDGQSLQSFKASSLHQLEQVAEALAIVNAKTNQFLTAGWNAGEMRRQPGLCWVKSYVKEVTDLLHANVDAKELLTFFIDHENTFMAWVQELPTQTINHNDGRSANVLFADHGVFLLDWDSANYGPWGASLRPMASLPKASRNLVINKYVETLRGFGYDVDPILVGRVMMAQYIFWELDRGLRHQNPAVAHRALRRFKRLLTKGLMK